MKILRQYTMATGSRETGFHVRGTGHFIIEHPEKDKYADFGEIFWCIEGCGLFSFHGKDFQLRPGWVWYYPPNSHHHFVPAPYLDYRWLSISGPDTGNLFHALRFKPGLNPAGNCPEKLFAEIILALRDGSRQSQMLALATAFKILTLAMTPQHDPQPMASQARDFILQHFSNPEINISTLADLLHIHRITLNRLFLEAYGIPPGKYLNNVRLQEGIRLLTESSRPVKEIAKRCGYASAGYFTRALHRRTGQTPRSFRSRKTDRSEPVSRRKDGAQRGT